ncbi:MAG: LysM peptidoglycan-binding domain-containing protein [Gammaproteobacteria bacterium]|nr:MAG: LysM peptidoglycan-binding domain-containing protein [Gammaproteobacteria bacterium]
MDVLLMEEAIEDEFFGELKEVLKVVDGKLVWTNQSYHTLPDAYTTLAFPAGELYLLTNDWKDENGNTVQFWYQPGVSQDLFVDPPALYIEPSAFKRSGGAVTKAAPAATADGKMIHVVQRGESLWKIATQYGVSLQSVIDANNLANPRMLVSGQRLIIPTH